MLDDFPHATRINLQRDDETSGLNAAHLNLSLNSFSGSLASRFACSQAQTNSLDHLSPSTSTSNSVINTTTTSNNNKTNNSNNPQHIQDDQRHPDGLHFGDEAGQHLQRHLQQHQQQHQEPSHSHPQSQHHSHHSHHHSHPHNHARPHHHSQPASSGDEQYFTSDETNSSNHNLNPTPASSAAATTVAAHVKSEPGFSRMLAGVDLAPNQKPAAMVPTTAHCSDQHNLHYSLSGAKALAAPSPSNMALNFSHDLLIHQSGQSMLHHHEHGADNGAADHKPGQLELDSGNLMQSAAAANMNIWKNTMNFGLKNEHGFLPTSDMNSFSSWPHGGNLNHHQGPPGVAHHILDGQHLIGYPGQHGQRSLHLNNQDLVGASLKTQVCAAEQASFVLNSINHSANSQAPLSNHHHSHHAPGESSHLRAQSLEHGATSYNLTMNDGQSFYNNRSHSSTIKSAVFLHDRQGPMSLSAIHQPNHMPYHSAEHLSSQPTTSHHVAGTSAGVSSKNIGSFRCPHCNELFSMRNQYQSHLKTHSQEKGSKAKFHCELCGHSFSQKTSLNRHMKSHTGERPFPCDVCGKAFSEKERLKIHMRTHTGEKPFSCGICGKSFSQKSTVKRHQTVHTGEKKFKCDCGKGFANRGNLIAHIKTRGSHHFE